MKDKKVNINIGYEKLSKEEIDSHKNFAKVYESFTAGKTRPMKVAKKYTITKIMIVATVTAVTVGVWKYKSANSNTPKAVSSVNSQATSNATIAKKPFIHPPIKGVDVPYKTYTVNASKGGVLAYNKSKITIPADVFCDEKGNTISGDVQINYREFHDAIDFFVSGIPMTYDSAGTTYNFESAGMLDVKGTQNGKPVYIKQGKDIQVAMSSFQTGTKYNVYALDTVKKNWTYIEKSRYVVQHQQMPDTMPSASTFQKRRIPLDTVSSVSAQAQTEIAAVGKELNKLEAEKPVKASDNNYRLNIDADTVTLPELAVFKNVLFEVDPSDKTYNPKWENIEWTDAKLIKAANGKSYVFTVSSGTVKHSILVNPVFQGKDFDNAMKKYTKQYNAYEAKIAAEQEELRKQKEAYKKMMIAEAKEQQRQAKIIREQQKNEAAIISKETTVMNYFTLNSFGVWNSDNPTLPSEKAQLVVNYTDAKDNNLNYLDTYLIYKDRNAIIENHSGHKCCFDPSERNFAWVITPNQKLAIYSEQDFKKITQTSGSYTFVMKVLDVQIATYEQVRNALKPYMN